MKKKFNTECKEVVLYGACGEKCFYVCFSFQVCMYGLITVNFLWKLETTFV